MKHFYLVFFLFMAASGNAQQRHVVLEEFTGANCGQCPMGSYTLDSMLTMYPDLIAVSLHSYGVYDAMYFTDLDTIGNAFALGAPLGTVDRKCSSPPSTNAGIYITQWDAAIQQRLSVPAQLTVDVIPSWNSSTRNITANITVNILNNLPAADYRITLYIVEDSVVGSGSGYDQHSYYDQQPGPFYGLGDPIVGFVHRHVARAILPSPWGQSGIIAPAPTTGQVFTTTMNYTLPANYNENKVHLVVLVNRVSSDHASDEVMNANEVGLLDTGSAIGEITAQPTLNLFPNPAQDVLAITFSEPQENCVVEILDATGKTVRRENVMAYAASHTVNVSDLPDGMYFIRAITADEIFTARFIHQTAD